MIPERYKVLLVEDDQVDLMAFERYVRQENLPYDYTVADSVAEASIAISEGDFDIAIMDYNLGDGTSIELFKHAKHLPIVIMTGSGDLHIAVEVMKQGAYDFLTKDVYGNYLIALPITVTKTVVRWRAQQELAQYRSHLEEVVAERTAAWLEGELRLRTIIEANPIIVFSLDLAANFTFVAGHTLKILGYKAADLMGKSLFWLLPALAEEEMIFQNALTSGSFTFDLEINHHWVSMSASARRENDATTGFIGVVNDISERKRAELAVVNERNLLRTLIDHIPDYIFIKDKEGRFIVTNHAHSAGANLSDDEIIHRTAMEVFAPELAEQFHADDMHVLTTGSSIINEERVTTGDDGSKRWVLTTKVPLHDDNNGNIIGLVGISRDITDRRDAETERLQAERLHLEVEQERELIEMKQRFIATATHDFRTPLSIIKMSADTLERYYEKLPHERRLAKLQQIKLQVDGMIKLLDDVLILSKMSAGKADLSLTNLDVKSFAERIWQDLLETDQQKHQHQFDYLATAQQIVADENALQHTLMNLLSNAFKYTPIGGKVQFQVDSDEHFVTFLIRDTGCGIPLVDQKHLFEPFFRATNVQHVEGTGLGLMIVKANLERHGGSISVQSEEGVGTTFTAQVPHTQ